jgi:hypothetical protein
MELSGATNSGFFLMNSGDDQVTNTNELPMMLTSDMFPQA